jgi:hypothetical protein
MYFLGLGLYCAVLLLGGQAELFQGGVFTPHDAFYPVTDFLAKGALGEYLPRNNFERNFISWFIHIPDLLFIAGLKIFMSNSNAQVAHIIFCYGLLFTLTFYCLGRLIKDTRLLCLLTLAYCLSPYMTVLYSGGTFYTFSTIFSLGVLPLFLFKLIQFPDDPDFLGITALFISLAYGIIFAYPALLALIFSVLNFYLFAPKVKRSNAKEAFINLLKFDRASIFLIGVALVPLVFFGFIYQFLGGSGITENNNPLQNGMYAAIKGSLMYPLMQISSWAIYSPWSPRVVMNFSDWFFTAPYKLLSLALIVTILCISIQEKKYRYLALLLFCAFLAKGSNPPFGDLFLSVINSFPLGFLIRSPDTKFGAFIGALIVMSFIYASTRKQRTILVGLTLAFLLNNIVGMYANGALSPSKASSTATYYQYDHEYQDVVKKINEIQNAVVLTNQGVCDLKMENERMYSCSDLVLSNIDKQTIGSSFGSLDKLSSKFDLFSRLIYLNHSVVGVPPVDVKAFEKQGYEVLYSSALYTLLSKQGQRPPCSSLNLPIACVFSEGQFIASANMSYANYYWPNLKPKPFGDFVVLEEPPFKTSVVRYWVLSWLYALGLIACFLGLFLGRRKQFSGN